MTDKKLKRTKQKVKENRVQRNAHNMKSVGGVRLTDREDRIAEVKRRQGGAQ